MVFIFGVLTLLVINLEEFILSNSIGFSILGLSLLFFPIGGIVLGALLGFSMSVGQKKTGKQLSKSCLVLALLLGALAVPSIYVVDYATTYIDESGEFNHSFKGEHISEYYYADSPIDFFTYMQFLMENSSSSFKFRHVPSDVTSDIATSSNYNYFILIAKILSFSLVAPFVLYGLTKHALFCLNCKKYYKTQMLFKVSPEDYQDVLQTIVTLLNTGQASPIKEAYNRKEYYEISISYCPECYDGFLTIDYFEENHKGEIEEVSSASKSFKVQNSNNLLLYKKGTA